MEEATADPLSDWLILVEAARFSLSPANSTSTSLLKEIFFCREPPTERSLLLPVGEDGAWMGGKDDLTSCGGSCGGGAGEG
jgi:hypothetical protein